MARENQGLQIALIIFVILTVGLGGFTYWGWSRYVEESKKADEAQKRERDNKQLADKNANDFNDLKKWVGAAASDNLEAVKKIFDEDKKNYGGAYSEDDRVYHRLVEKMSKTIKDRNAELADARAEIPKLQDEYKKREEARDLQVKQYQDSAAKASQDRDSEQAKYKGERDRITQDETKLQADLQAARKSSAETIAKIDDKLQAATQRIKKLLDASQETNEKLQKLTEGKIDSFNGEINWVNQRERTVWINLGRADALTRQVTFAVFSAGSTDTNQAKAGVEVTQILGDHLSEARILTDSVSDPIVPGDKIFTPLWSPGEVRHFALAGLMDIDGDGHSDLNIMKKIIESAGGVVDCWIADSGKNKNKIQGSININTSCLILGAAPDDKGDPAQREAFTTITNQANQFRLPKMQLADFLQRIGWKNMSPVVRYGRGANPNDFRAKPDDGVVRKSTGNTSDVFKDREPPASKTGRYYKF